MPLQITTSLLRSGENGSNYGTTAPLLDEETNAFLSDKENAIPKVDKNVAKLMTQISKSLGKCQSLSHKIDNLYETPLPIKNFPKKQLIATDPLTKLYYKYEAVKEGKKQVNQETAQKSKIKKYSNCLRQEELKLSSLKEKLGEKLLTLIIQK